MGGATFDDAWLAQHRAKQLGRAATQASPPSNDNPTPATKARAKRRDLETPIHIAIYDFLRYALPAPLEAMHIPNGEARGKRAAGRLKAMGTRPGAADLIIFGFIRNGVASYIWFEVKSEEGVLSTSQKAWQAHCALVGAPWFLVRSIDDAAHALRSLNIKLKVKL